MYSFKNDYSEAAHPNILEAICRTGMEQNTGYGLDSYSEQAKEMLRRQMQNDTVDIYFLPGGTITNLTLISQALRPYQAVIAASTGHINVHETGAIEATGHKVVTAAAADGKLTTDMIQSILDFHADEHYVKPAMVYVSNPTELGTVYTRTELEVLSGYCKEKGLLFYLDGARLAMALACSELQLTLADLARLTDAFYIGGTKIGALFGEALVIVNDSLKADMRYNIKQHGAMTAKGWLLGIQFKELFTDNLYVEMGAHANKMADILRQAFTEAGFSFLADSPTNQVFPILPNTLIEKINENYITSTERVMDDTHTAIRFCTSWATEEADVRRFVADFKRMLA